MRGFTLFDGVLDLAAGISEFALQWLVQSTLILAIGLVVAILLRRGRPALRSVVCRTTLVAALACPLLAYGLSSAGLTFVTVKLPSARVERLEWVEAPRDPAQQATPGELEQSSSRKSEVIVSPELAQSDVPFASGVAADFGEPSVPQVTFPAATIDSQVAAVDPPEFSASSEPMTLIERRIVSTHRILAIVFFGVPIVWGIVTLGLLARLVADHLRLARLRKLAVPVDEQTHDACQAVAERLHVPLPGLKRTPFLASPCLSGVFRPVILLPEDICGEALSPVMVHELAHLKRGDCFWNLLSYLSVIVLWPQPLLWSLVRRIESAAEDVCDDYVLQYGESRVAYAKALLSLAERNLLPASGAAVSLLTIRSLLGRRIERILDTTRGLSLTVGFAALILVVAGGMSAALVAGMLGPASDRAKSESTGVAIPAEKAPAADVEDAPQTSEAPSTDQVEAAADENLLTVRGVVLDPDGKPLPGAEVYAAWMLTGYLTQPSSNYEYRILAQGKSDEQGNFELTFSTNHPNPPHVSLGWHVAAFAPGLAPAWQTDEQVRKNIDDKQSTVLTLSREEIVRGRIVDLEGNPISGVQVRVHTLRRPESERALLDWLTEAKEKSPPAHVNDYYNNSSFFSTPKSPYAGPYPAIWSDRFLQHGSPALPDTSTDENGEFLLPGLGADQLAVLELQSPKIAKCYVHVVVRDMAPTSARPFESLGVRSGTYFGKQFQFVAEPTQPITGTVTDADSGEPLANVEVRIEQIAGAPFPQQDFLTTRTDQQGNYALIGVPSGGGHQVEVNPSPDEPYFPTKKKLAKTPGIDPIELNFAVHRGQWIVGKLTDQDTGEPIHDAYVEYLPLRDNAFAQDYPNYRPEIAGQVPSQRYRSSDDGSFRVLAIPGPGILAAIARNEDSKLYSSLTRDLVPEHLVQADAHLKTYHPWNVTGYHALREVNLAKSADDTALDLQLTKGLTRTVNLVDAQGQAVKGVHVLSRNAPPSLEGPLDDSTVKIIGLRPNESREVVFIQVDRRIGKAVTITAGDEMTVALESCAVVRGRVVDEDGRAVAELAINVTVDKSDDWHRPLVGATTDTEGRFEALLPPGIICRVWHFSRTGSDFSAECRGQEGAIFELGDLTNESKLDASQTDKLRVTTGEDKKLNDASLEQMSSADKIEAHAAASTDAPAAERFEFAGKVVDPAGKPKAGARVALLYYNGKQSVLSPAAKTGHDGGFLLRVANDLLAPDDANWATLVVTTDDYAFACDRAAPFEASGSLLKLLESHSHYDQFVARSKDRTLRLDADDVPISGRIINLEGQGVAGARIRVRTIYANPTGGLDAWLKDAESGEFNFDQLWKHVSASLSGQISGEAIGHLLPEVVADSEGRFLLTGVGRDRLIKLLVSGEGLETRSIYVRTRPGATLRIPNNFSDPDAGFETCYGPTFDLVLAPSRPITGIVRDIDTGDPLAGIQVVPEVIAGTRLHNTFENDYLQSTTDAQGAYRISGLPIGTSMIAAIPPRDVRFAAASLEVETDPERESISLDFQLKRGVWIRGHVTDAETGQPVRGIVEYYVSNSNPLLRTARGVLEARSHGWVKPDGSYQIVGLPGPGLISLLVNDGTSTEKYPRGAGADAIDLVEGSNDGLLRTFSTSPHFLATGDSNYVAQFNPDESVDTIEHNISLHAGKTLSGRVLDDNGQPLAGAQSCGLSNFGSWSELKTADFEVRHLQTNLPRRLYFHHAQKQLAGSVELRGDEISPLAVRLVPAGTIKGRLLLEDGVPATRVALRQSSRSRVSDPRGVLPNAQNLHTDGAGNFEIVGLGPGLHYSLSATRGSRSLGTAFENVTIAAGESKDLGDVKLVDDEQVMAELNLTSQAETPRPQPPQVTVSGRVTLADGAPASGTHIAAIAVEMQPARGGLISPRGKILAEGIADAQGDYRLSFPTASSQSHRNARLIARKDGFAIAWQSLDLDAPKADASLTLAAEEPIRGRLVDIEGEPASEVKLTIRSLTKTTTDRGASDDGVSYSGDAIPAAWFQDVVSDKDGRFVIAGVPAGCGVFLDVAGSELFAPQNILLNTDMPEQRGERDNTYRPLIKNAVPGEEAVLPLAPAQLFEGVVTYEDSGEPAGLARLTIWASQQEQFGSMISVAGKADKDGRYRISPHPGVRFGVIAYPPDGTPYLARTTPLSPAIPWQAGDRVKKVDMKLPRGVQVRGTVVEAESGVPVAGASIQYIPEQSNNPYTAEDILTGWQALELTDDEGKFAIAVLPGPGRLLVHGPQGKFILRETSDQELSRGKPGGQRNYAHAIERIEPAQGADLLDLTISIEPGVTITGSIVDEKGQPIDEAIVVSRLNINPSSPYFRGFTPESKLGGKFELTGLDPKQEYNVSFIDPKRRLGATLVLSANDADAKVVLKPCGQAVARFVDADGQPHVGFNPGLHMILTPGVHEHDWSAAKLGNLAADADFVSNIDPKNHRPGPKTDEQGRVTFEALIPGTTYRLSAYKDGKPSVLKEFSLGPGEQIDVGEHVIDLD